MTARFISLISISFMISTAAFAQQAANVLPTNTVMFCASKNSKAGIVVYQAAVGSYMVDIADMTSVDTKVKNMAPDEKAAFYAGLPRPFPAQPVVVEKEAASIMSLGKVAAVKFSVLGLFKMEVSLYQSLVGALFDSDKAYAGNAEYKDADGKIIRENVDCILKLNRLEDF